MCVCACVYVYVSNRKKWGNSTNLIYKQYSYNKYQLCMNSK